METEIWKAHPEYAGIEVSTLGNVRTMDRILSSEKITRFIKGRILKQYLNHNGYLQVGFRVDGKRVTKRVHRLVAQTFIPNTNNLSQVNHKDCDSTNNNASNLEWCNNSYNQIYREKFGISATESLGVPVFAINLTTLKVSRFRSQNEAGRELGVHQSSINKVIKGKYKKACGYWFTNDDGHKDAEIQQKIAEGQRAAKQKNKDLSQAIEDAQIIKDYSDQAVKSVSAK